MTVTASKATILQRTILPLVLAVSLGAVTVYYLVTGPRLSALSHKSDKSLLGLRVGKQAEGVKALASVGVLGANPLDQQAVNNVIAARARASGDIPRAMRETGLLRQLGWRSNLAMQNLLWKAGTTRDVPLMMDTMDALLRREKLLGQIYPILNLMTLDPSFRGILARRLATRPPWRRYYFMSASDLSKPNEIEGRYQVMREVQLRGDRLARNEVAPILPKLINIGKTAEAFGLWQRHVGSITSPLADTQFDAVAHPLPADALPIPFEWQLGSGSGYFADAGRDEHGGFLSIDWDGRGVPALASQVTTARAGRYRLDVVGEPSSAVIAGKIGFRLACNNGVVSEFSPTAIGSGNRLQMTIQKAVLCDFPELQIFGLVQPATYAGSIVLRSVRITRIAR